MVKVRIASKQDSKSSIANRFALKFQKWQEKEAERKALNKQNINRSIKPKGYVARKFGVVTFWVLFSFMFLVVMVTIFNNSDSKQATTNEVALKENYATSAEARQFAVNFIKDYFTWTDSKEGIKKRTGVMAKYMPEALSENVGTSIKNTGWNSTFKNVELKQVKDKGENLSQMTFLVEFELTKATVATPPVDQVQAQPQGTPTTEAPATTPEVKKTQKYFVVPVIWDGKTFGVYELPKFSYIYESKTTLEEVKYEKLDQADVQITKEIEKFLPAFFKSYAENSKVELDYMISNEKVTEGLNGTMLFDSIKNSATFEGKKEKQFIVFTEVVFLDPDTKVPFHTNYQLEITKNKEKLLVSGMDNQKYDEVVSTKENVFAEVNNRENTEPTQENSQ